MADLKKTLLGLECCTSGKHPTPCGNCQYYGNEDYNDPWSCRIALMRDAIFLLKKQDQKEKECEKCAHKTSAAIESLQENLKEKRAIIKEITDGVLTDLIETGKLIPPMVMSLDDMQAIEEGQFIWIEVKGDNLYCAEVVQVCKGNGKVSEISINEPHYIYGINMCNYNVTWRRWDTQPTSELMGAMPWMN